MTLTLFWFAVAQGLVAVLIALALVVAGGVTVGLGVARTLLFILRRIN